jgi:hypothetical protein
MFNFMIPVTPENIRTFKDPLDPSIAIYRALVRVQNLPPDLPLDPNPRPEQNLNQSVAKAIASGLRARDGRFHLLNRGITILASQAAYDNQQRVLKLFIDQDEGIMDGGHTYKVILAANVPSWDESKEEEGTKDQYVNIEVMTGIQQYVDIARARNTSVQVKEESIAHLIHKFEWIQDAIKRQPYKDRIGYHEFAQKDADVIDLIQCMTVMNAYRFANDASSQHHPVFAYSATSRVLKDFLQDSEQQSPTYPKLKGLLNDILRLRDHLELHFPEYYREAGGLNDTEGGRFRRLKEIRLTASHDLIFLNKQIDYVVPDGWLMPVLASMRVLVDNSGEDAKWKTSPFAFADEIGPSLLEVIIDTSKQLGRNPNAVGKSKSLWSHLYVLALNRMLSKTS